MVTASRKLRTCSHIAGLVLAFCLFGLIFFSIKKKRQENSGQQPAATITSYDSYNKLSKTKTRKQQEVQKDVVFLNPN